MPAVGDTLLQETHHRCSNDLQMIVSLLSLQSRRARSDETRVALSDAADRFAVLAHARSAMFDGGTSSLEIAFRRVCHALSLHAEPRSIAITFRVDQPVGDMPADRIAAVTLVANELITNAIKYAFQVGVPGQITVTVGRSADGAAVVAVVDDGMPFPDQPPPGGSGMGLRLARRLMTSIDGQLIEPTGTGKAFELRFSNNNKQVTA